MSALIQLGLSHLQQEPVSVSIDAREWIERFTTADEWLKKVFEGIEKLPKEFKDAGKLGEILEKAAPWIESGSKAFPPAHLLFQIVSSLTKINDPRDLAIIACTVAYQAVADKAIRDAGLPEGKSIKKRLRDSIGVTRDEFAYFTIEGVLTHPFIRRADEVLEFYAATASYDDRQIELLIGTIHSRFREELRLLMNSGENSEKYAPLRNWLGTDAKEALIREALRRHVQYVRWLFEEAPLLEEEPYALKHIYMDTGCGLLTRSQLQEKDESGRPKRDPFKRDEENGGVRSLLETVLGYIRNPEFNDAIVIQGSAGAGKSSFTKHLAATLAIDGLVPLLVRLRDARNIGQGLFRTVGDALRYDDQVYQQSTQDRFQPPPELLGNGSLFNESVPYYGASICPYVLILDGWDEISLDVADGYKQKVQALLAEIRQEFFRGRHARVRVILTGRPSDAIDGAESFFNDGTPLLTVRQMTPEQLVEFASKVRAAVDGKPLKRYINKWQMPLEQKLGPLFVKYENGFENDANGASEQVLGVPFLAQLAFRAIADPGPDGDRVAEDSTTLLRRITEITVHHARLSTDQFRIDSAKNAEKVTGKKLYGDPLRRLLHRTAAKMTIVGRESVSHKELDDYLQASNDAELIAQAERAGGITGLMISFFFKGGNTQLGCEFTHKALREYLFAEAVVECIKALANHVKTSPLLGIRPHYWRDFGEDDPRHEWSRSLAELLSPQWLTEPVRIHIFNLLGWEKRQATAGSLGEGATKPLTPAQWIYVRDGMADAYDWWAEGVPMRPQLSVKAKKNDTEWNPPHFQTLIEEQLVRPVRSDILTIVPPRLTTYDGHFGAALMSLTSAVHQNVRELITETGLTDALRGGCRTQSQQGDTPVRFRPDSGDAEFFRWYCDRINAAGWYRSADSWAGPSRFPRGVFLQGIDLRGTDLSEINLIAADLTGAELSFTVFSRTFLVGAYFVNANLTNAYFTEADCIGANFSGANLKDASIVRTDLHGADFTDANLTNTTFRKGDLTRTILTHADLSNADFTDADLSGAFLNPGQVDESSPITST
jgi:hypothetical protein